MLSADLSAAILLEDDLATGSWSAGHRYVGLTPQGHIALDSTPIRFSPKMENSPPRTP